VAIGPLPDMDDNPGWESVAAPTGEGRGEAMAAITREQIYAVVKRHLLELIDDLPEDQIDPVRSMKDLGANSLDIVEVVSLSMRELKVKVPRAELAKLTNLDGLVDLLYAAANEAPETRSA